MKKVCNYLKENLFAIIVIFLIVLMCSLFIGITYAYFDVNFEETSDSIITIGGAELSIKFESYNSNLYVLENVKPSSEAIGYKDFSITIKNPSSSAFKIYLKADIYNNTFTDIENDGVLYYDIYSGSSYDTLYQAKKMFPTISCGKAILNEINIPANSNTTTNYRLNLYFLESDKVQNKKAKLTMSGKIIVENTNDTYSDVCRVPSFADDSWDEIAEVVKKGHGLAYKVGSEKEVLIGSKSYTVRVANNTTPSECDSDDFSQTACGFVVEFVDSFSSGRLGKIKAEKNVQRLLLVLRHVQLRLL